MTDSVPGTILAINAGSSSVKFQLFDRVQDLKRVARGAVTNISGDAGFSTKDNLPAFAGTDERTHVVDKKTLPIGSTHEAALRYILEWVEKQSEHWKIAAVAHRVVHGGALFKSSVPVTPEVMRELKFLVPLAPLHMPHNLAAIEIASKIKPDAVQIACFDTAFHANHKNLFTEYALPLKLRGRGIRRFGFHGLSYEWIAAVLKRDEPILVRNKIIAAHLGNGASLCAMKDGLSIDTTMGMTALEGLPMGTRSGSLDPGAMIYMMRELRMSAKEIEHILYNESGLLGLSDSTNDVKLLQDDRNNPKAQFALDYFALKVAQFIGMMAVSIGGVDGIVFTGGIGENSVSMRTKILDHIAFLKPFEVRIIRANEERIMAMHAQSLLGGAPETPKAGEDEDDGYE